MPPATDASKWIDTPRRQRLGEQLAPVRAEQCLVRGHDVLAIAQRLHHVCARGLQAAHHLDDDADVGIVEDVGGIRGLPRGRQLRRTPCPGMAQEHALDRDASPDPLGDRVLILLEDAYDAATDVPRAEQADGDAAHPTSAR